MPGTQLIASPSASIAFSVPVVFCWWFGPHVGQYVGGAPTVPLTVTPLATGALLGMVGNTLRLAIVTVRPVATCVPITVNASSGVVVWPRPAVRT